MMMPYPGRCRVAEWCSEHVHLHPRRGAVGRRGEVGVVGASAGAVLGVGLDGVVAQAAAAVVVGLEVARGRREAVLVMDVVENVVPVEQIGDRGLRVVERRSGRG